MGKGISIILRRRRQAAPNDYRNSASFRFRRLYLGRHFVPKEIIIELRVQR